MNCPVCKADNAATAKFCCECGLRLEFQCPYCTAPTAAGAKFCTECGSSLDFRCMQCSAVNRPGAKFCQACGVRLITQCFTCGVVTPPGARFCQNCGGRLERRCTGCGTPIVFGAHYCNGCGAPLGGTQDAPGQPMQPIPLVTLPPRPQPAPQPMQPVAQAPIAPPPAPMAPPQPQVQPPVYEAPPVTPYQAPPPPVVMPPAAQAAPPPPPIEASPPAPLAPPAPQPTVQPSAPTPVPVVFEAALPPEPVAAEPPAPPAPVEAAPASPPTVEEPPPAREDERRLVTVLFGDVSGFTAMSEKLDPEETKLIMDRCLKQLADQVFKFEGTVDKFEGDLIMAVWGAPTAHEDDAERAVLAALDMQKVLAEFSADLQRRKGFTLRMRIGLNTGEVISGTVGSGRDKDYTVMGDVVNTASRFESNAEPGTIMVGEKTHALTRHLIDYLTLDPIMVKGKSEPLNVYRAQGVLTDRGLRRGVAGLESPMVGRTDKLWVLQQSFLQTVMNKQPHMVTVLGVPGIGKSRLLAEYEASLKLGGNDFTWCKGRCVPYGQGITFYPLAEILKTFVGVKESDSLDFVQDALLNGILRVVKDASEGASDDEVQSEARQLAHRLGYAIGVSYPDADLASINPANLKDELFWAWRRFLGAWSANKPLVFVVEDVHWADPVVLDLLQSVARGLEGAAIQFLCLSRPELLEEQVDWTSAPNSTVVRMEPLGVDQSIELIDNLLAPNLLSRSWKERLANSAGGVPFFIEEFVRSLIEEEQVTQGPAGWGPTHSERMPELPDSIFATLFSRLDRLPSTQKTLIQRASVVGDTFWESSLRFPAPALGSDAVALGQLQAQGWVGQHDESAFLGDLEYGFVNHMVRESAYKGLTRRRRSEEHYRVAQWLEDRVGDRLQEFIELLAYHYGQGALQALDDDEDDAGPLVKAISYGWQAAERARLHSAFHEALTRYDDTLRLVDRLELREDPALTVGGKAPAQVALDVLLARAQVKEPLGQYDAALTDVEQVLSQAVEQQLTPMQASGYAQKARLLRLMAQPDEAISCVEEAIKLYREGHDIRGEATALSVLGELRSDRAELEKFESTLRQALVLARLGDLEWLEAKMLTLLGTACIQQGKMGEAPEHLLAAAETYRRIGDRRGMASSYLMLGRVEHATGNSRDAVAHVEEAYAIFHEMGDQPMRVASLVTLGQLHLERGNLNPCRMYSQTALELAKTLGQHAQAIRATLILAQAELADEPGPNLAPQLLEAMDLCKQTNQVAILPEVYRLLAQVYVALHDPVEGEKFARLGREVVEEDDHYSQGTTWYALALTLAAQPGRQPEAEEVFHKALEQLEEAEEGFEIGDGHLAYAVFLMDNGRADEAGDHLAKAHEAFTAIGTRDRLARIEDLQARLEPAGMGSVSTLV